MQTYNFYNQLVASIVTASATLHEEAGRKRKRWSTVAGRVAGMATELYSV